MLNVQLHLSAWRTKCAADAALQHRRFEVPMFSLIAIALSYRNQVAADALTIATPTVRADALVQDNVKLPLAA